MNEDAAAADDPNKDGDENVGLEFECLLLARQHLALSPFV
jgi:hypothetical protein